MHQSPVSGNTDLVSGLFLKNSARNRSLIQHILVIFFLSLLAACTKATTIADSPTVLSERVLEVSAEKPYIEDAQGGRIGVEGFSEQGTVRLKEVTSLRSDGKTVVSFETVPDPDPMK